MGGNMWPPGVTRFLVIAVFLIATPLTVRTQGSSPTDPSIAEHEIQGSRIHRDVNGVTTVLLVPARPGKSVPPVGLLTKTARTFVQDGASTEYATQVLGTTLDNGRLYARILSTSSRVFYDKELAPSSAASPFVVYPSKAPQDEWQLRIDLENAPVKIAKDLLARNIEDNEDSDKSSDRNTEAAGPSGPGNSEPLDRENDIFNKREPNIIDNNQRFKPAKVRVADNLPTYTVNKDYTFNNGPFEDIEEEAPRNYRPRVPKIFKPQGAPIPAPKKQESKPLATVTYHGFADFTTIVGDTVIVFSPSTSPAPAGRAATTIKGDATLRPDDGIGIMIQPTSVVESNEKTLVSLRDKPRDQLLDAINGGGFESAENDNLQPSRPSELEVESSSKITPLLVPFAETGILKPTGLLNVVDSTTVTDGTTTHYKSLIYGTYLGTNYAQVIHTSSNVYFFPDEASATYDQDTTLDYTSTDAETEETDIGTTLQMPRVTTPEPLTTTEKNTPETNEVTIPYRETTENILTTLKDILANAKKRFTTTTEVPENVETNTDSDITNDIATGDPQGRSVKGSSPKNNFPSNDKDDKDEKKVSFATRLLPSTEYKTFTYFTTFFVPDGDRTTTSIKSREVVSAEVTYLTELILPSATSEPSPSTALNQPKILLKRPTLPKVLTTTTEEPEEETTKQDEEIELIFKTLYTTYTYLTTFFQESTSSISSREVVETNVVTQTVGPNGVSGDVAGLFDRDESIVISATKVPMTTLPTMRYPTVEPERVPEEPESFTTEATPTTIEETTEDTLTTIPEQQTTIDDSADFTTSEDDEDSFTNLEPSPTPSMATEVPQEQIKTYFTTYTYFTTIFVDDETEIETRTEVFTNVVTEGIKPTAVVPVPVESSSATTPKSEPAKSAPPPEILAYLEAIQRQKSQEEALLLAKRVQQQSHIDGPSAQETTINDFTTESMLEDDLTTMDERFVTENSFVNFPTNGQVTPNPPVDGEVLGSMITDVVSSSSSGGGTVLGVMDKRNAVPEDQELSESNHHDVESAPTLLLQTSYTTFTYFTTMYKGDATNVVSRLDTVTNVVTETIRPTSVLGPETSTLPVTYFTTFTYWTTFYKGGDTVTTSREETVSNVVTPGVSPTPTLELGVVMTYRPTVTPTPVDEDIEISNDTKVVADNEVTPSDLVNEKTTTEKTEIATPKEIITLPENDKKIDVSTIAPEPTTFYTTFTYFTTSYIGNETILNSRLETITSVALPETTARQATGRAIGGGVPSVQAINIEEKIKPTLSESVKPSKTEEGPKTGLISTIRTSKIAEGTTTHFTTDVYGTYIDGLYAQVVESSSRLETATPALTSSATPVLPTGILSLNKGSIVDADEVTTVYFTTKQIGTLIDGLYAKVIESTSSTKIDAEKKATIAPVQGHRTGLVRLIKGHIETNDVTTVYQSKVIGTSIDGRYAQIIESTSSFAVSKPTLGISPSSTLPPGAASAIPEIAPSPAVIQSSLSEDSTTEPPGIEEDDASEQNEESEDDEEDGEDEDGQKSKKKSRLTFSSRKRTFTPVIRPFLSRSRPTFNPKRKGAQAATTITRTDITPTITATLAGKGNRFASSRGRVSSPIGPYSSTLASSGARRFSGRGRGSSTLSPSLTSGFPAGSTRGRGAASRITPSSAFSVNRRGPSSVRGSSTRPGPRGSSSVYPGASSRFRPGIRPSSTLTKVQPTVRHEDQDDEANEYSTTTLTTEEAPPTEYDEGSETVTAPLQTTTESTRRSTNPLLRFRRPLNVPAGQRTVVTPRIPTPTPRRNANLARQNNAPTGQGRGSIRGGTRPTPPLSTRSRQGGQLFPPRGLLNRKPDPIEEPIENEEEFEGEDEENFEDDPVEEIADNDYEGSEDATSTARYGGNRRQGKAVAPTVKIRPFGRARRVRRQASQLRSLTNRFRRPTSSSAKAEDRSDFDVSASREDFHRSVAPTKQSSRYSARGRSLSSPRPSPNTYKSSAEKLSAESSESLVKPRVRTTPRVKPTPTSGSSRQFTLREKDSSSRPGFKRTSTTSSRNRSTGKPESGAVRPRPRIRTGSSRPTENPTNRRVPSSRSPSRSSSNNRNNNRRVPSHRGRGSQEDIRETPYVHKDNDGTITVTHYIPTEVTIPVVNNGITEQKNIITAHPSKEVLGPDQYSTVVGGDGRPLVVIVSEATGSNAHGQLEVTRFLLHETPTTRVSHTLTSLGGRRASQSIIVPTTVYSVENVISTIQPSLSGGNAPLANILLSQLLLGQLAQPNALLGGMQPQGTPTTQYNTRTTSYVTTITKHQSTVIPLTFRGKEIFTTLLDSSTNVVTATEYITDTVVVTPTAALPAASLNSLLLLLQQPQQQQPAQHPLLDPLFAAAPLLTQSNTLPGEVERRHQPADFDYKPNNYDDSEEEIIIEKPTRPRVRPGNAAHRYNDRKEEKPAPPPAESSVITLYVSGKRPGEFSTVLSTVKISEEATVSRRRRDTRENATIVRASAAPSLHAATATGTHLAGSEEPVNAHAPTQSLESVVDETLAEQFEAFGRKKTRELDHRWKQIEDDYGRDYAENDEEDSRDGWRSNVDERPRKVFRVRVPVVRSRMERQHKYTVVRRRPLIPYSKPAPIVVSSPTARRIVVTRVRSRGPANQLVPEVEDIPEPETLQLASSTRHRVTVTRRRKIQPTTVLESSQRPRVTRKKLVNVRPVVQPTPTFAIITTGFYSAPSTSEEDEYEDEEEFPVDEELPVEEKIEEPKTIASPEETPSLNESPNDIDSKPEDDFEDSGEDEPSKFELSVPEEEPSKVDTGPVIITDHFFLPAADSDDEEYEGEEYSETTTGSEEGESVVTENPQLLLVDEDKNLEDSKDLLEVTTLKGMTQVAKITDEIVEETTEKNEEQSEEYTEAPIITTTDTDETTFSEDSETTEKSIGISNENEFTDPETTVKPVTIYIDEEKLAEITVKPVTIHFDEETKIPETTIEPVTVNIYEEKTSPPETTIESVTINIDEEKTSLPETTVKPLTIYIDREKNNVTEDESVSTEVTISSEEKPEKVPEEETTTVVTTEKQIVESDVSAVTEISFESPITERISESPITDVENSLITESIEEDDLSVVPLESYEKSLESSTKLSLSTYDIRPSSTWSPTKNTKKPHLKNSFAFDESDIPSVIPLEAESTYLSSRDSTDSSLTSVTTSYASPTPEDIEAGLADDLYLSLSRPDFPQISSSKAIDNNDYNTAITSGKFSPTPELSTSVYYTETVVTSTKLRTYTYVVTKLNGLETEVTSSTTVRPRVTTLTLNVPVTVTISPTVESPHNSVAPVYSPVPIAEYEVKEEEEGRRFNLATRVMSNGVEVIVAGPTPALRWENSNPQPTLTLSDTVVMLLPQEEPNEFVTKTCTTTFTYLNTITKDGATIVSTDQQVVANTATEERHRKPGTESASVTLEASPTLRTEVFKTTYTYLTLNTDHPDANNALGSSMKVITNTVTAPQHYLDMLEPSEAAQPETNTYLSTRQLEKTFMEDGRTRIETTSDTVTQLIITESAPPPPRPTSVATTLTALDNTDESMTDIMKTYFITYTYFNTYLEKGSTVVHTNVATSTDVVLEKVPAKKTTVQSVAPTQTPEPIQIFATKTYLTTFTYFTTLLQAGSDGETSTTISSRSHIVENVVTESIAPSLLDAGYMNALLTTAHHSDSVKNVVTGSTIIFFDEEDQIDPTTTSLALSQSTASPEVEASDKVPESTSESLQVNPSVEASGSAAQTAGEQVVAIESDGNATSSEDTQNKRPSNTPPNGVSNLLSLGSLGINSLSALGPVITAMAGMAGLLQGKPTATRRNDTVAPIEAQESTTQRSPIYIPVAEFADGDIETAESQNIAAQLANPNPNLNFIPETRHKVAASLADGIPISPGEVITANSDVIIGKPGKLGPRPPHTKGDEHIGMKPPPIPVPNIPVHPVLEVVNDDDSDSQAQASIQSHRNTQIQILSAHQVYEKHLQVPGPSVFSSNSQGSSMQKRPHQIQTGPPLRLPGNKHDQLENDPLLKPPSRPNVEQYANPNINPKDSEWNRDRFRRPWSAKDPLTPPLPPRYDEIQTPSQETKPWPNRQPTEEQKRPPWAQKDPLLTETTVILESSESKPSVSEPIIHQVPHVIDRSTGQPLLVNIQPSQVANVVIPQGGTQALIFGDTSEPHISGQYFDDPSPYPEPEVGPGFVGVEKIENNPADYMVPPAPPVNFKPLPQKPNNRDHPHTIPFLHSQNHFNLGRPQDNSEISTNTRLDKRPSEVLLIQRPDSHGQSSGQGHVHTEILVQHRPESVNVRPQIISQNHDYGETHEPPRRDYTNKHSRPTEQAPSRIDIQTESPHQYIYLENKQNDAAKEVKQNWKYDRKPQRVPASSSRPDRRPDRPARPHPPASQSYPIFERPGAYPGRKPQYSSPPARPNQQSSGHFSGNPTWHSQAHPQISQEPPNQSVNQRPHQFYPNEQVSRPTNAGHEANPSENVPTGAIGYYNPSTDPKVKPVDTRYYPQLATIKPEVQTFGEILPHPDSEHEISWQIDTQTERTSADSESDASENVKFHNAPPQDHREENSNHGPIDKQDEEIEEVQTSSSNTRPESGEIHAINSYDTVGSVNTVVGKPLDIAQSIIYENQNKSPPNYGHQQKQDHAAHDFPQDSYNSRPHENPIVQGKPYGVYNGQIDRNRPYVQHQNEDVNRPDYEVIQGVPFSQHGGKRPTARPYDRDDTTDLKPPAIPQFGSTPGRPFSKLHGNSRPENRPSSRPRPEHESNKNRPGANRDHSKIPTSGSNEAHSRPGSMQNSQESAYPRPDWSQGTQTSENSRPDHRDHFDNPEINDDRFERRNQTNKDSIQSSYFPSSIEDNNNSNNKGNKKDDQPPQVFIQTAGTRVHPAYPHILTKPRPRVPGPVTISSGSKKPEVNNGRPKIQFSLPVEASGEDKDSKTQTERPPSMLVTANGQKNKKQKEETLETAFQTNFATSATDEEDSVVEVKGQSGITTGSKKQDIGLSEKPKVPSQDMMPPPLTKTGSLAEQANKKKDEEGLKPPPLPSDVVGLSPPPVAITTTGRPKEDRFSFGNVDGTGLRPPPKYIPLKDSVGVTPPRPSTSMVPPSPRPTIARPFLVDLLSQDMVPPPLVFETSRPSIEIATVRPAIAVSGSIQIATAVAASHIPVIQDIESKIPIIHGTVDLPVVMDVSDIMKQPLETKKSEHVSIYTVRPFETRPISRVSVQPTTIITTNLIMPTKLRPPQIDHVETAGSSISRINSVPTRAPSYDIPRRPTKRPDYPVFLEPSRKQVQPSMEIEATESLTRHTNRGEDSKFRGTQVRKYPIGDNSSAKELPTIVTRVHSSITRTTNTPIPRRDKLPKTKEFAGTVIHEVVKNGTTATVEMKPKAVTHYRTLTVTRTETSVLGSPPTTRTLLLTHTLTSTIVETVTETLLRPTSVVATVTSTILQSVTRLSNSYENTVDNDSIFVVMSDQNPPSPGAEEVEAEYGEEEISRDEQDPVGNEINRVLAGGILGAPVAPMRPAINQCQPECKASKAEVCSAAGTEARCVCRPGFARMFPDRPCKPTYTYTLRVGLERMGREPVFYEAALNDTTSTAFKRLAGPTKEALDRTMMQSDLRDVYRSLEIAGFVPNPTQVEFHVQLSDNANETRLKEVIRKYLIGSNYSLGGTEVFAARDLEMIDARDFDECSMQEGGPHHDCSQHAACFNLRGSYQCSCREGWADLSENPAYPGRVCSQAPLGCAGCNNKGHCTSNVHGHEVCECFPWHSGQRCQVNLKVLLIVLVTTGAILLGFLAVCLGLACFRQPGRRGKSGDRRAMIPGTGGDTSSEGSVTDLAIPHHVPHVLPPPPRSVAPAPPAKRPTRKITPNGKRCRSPRKASITAPVQVNEEQCDRSLTVMIPRAKYRSTPQSPQNYKPAMSTFAADEHKLISYLESGAQPGNRKLSLSSTKDYGKSYEDSGIQMVRSAITPSGALVSAGFQVSATVTRTGDVDSTMVRGEKTQIEPSMKTMRSSDLQGDVGSTLARSCAETSTSTKLLRLDFGDSSGSTMAKSCGETTIQTSTKLAPSRRSDSKDMRDARDSGSEGHMTMERDLGSTLRLTPQHPALYKPDRASDRDSNFDSL